MAELTCCIQRGCSGAGASTEQAGLERDLQIERVGRKLCACSCPPAFPSGRKGKLLRKLPIMTYRTCQNTVLIGSFVLLFAIIFYPFLPFIPALIKNWGPADRVYRLAPLETPTVAAATIVKVWTYKKTGVYYCPDSKLYGKVKPGDYMTQEKALERGYRPAGQEPCR